MTARRNRPVDVADAVRTSLLGLLFAAALVVRESRSLRDAARSTFWPAVVGCGVLVGWFLYATRGVLGGALWP